MSLPLTDALRQCARHTQRMQSAIQRIHFPLDSEELTHADDDLITLLDQFVFRYTKLQDALGEHVLRAFCVHILLEPMENRPLMDVLALLERHSYLTASDWHIHRAMRNTLTHEYPEQASWQAAILNQAYTLSQQLVALLTRLTQETEKYYKT